VGVIKAAPLQRYKEAKEKQKLNKYFWNREGFVANSGSTC